ncbi:tRNA (adenosine(37)-N6)-dimethylallyltransferase MiaA [Fibrella sp. HMF5335]|uniref:tRNA dimethylallyltransferase n=1 Tax=Fibrella rubiginis TaxID=2817060 RepID=A0A939GE81_9BACT|nr:tRNA (adenosine(37)-N6)-dimethylallyltransferase MiaA [Fibrella rubiginis]MBO0935205.1 tRNA (adenosine(37)-N6)-dimethylallyltransferase MiaA [Fibrella rubiginis]
MKTVLVIAGPTAVGKTALSVDLAQRFQTEIISADSRQLYQEMTIGTAKPTVAEMAGVRHHFIDSHSIHAPISAGQYEREVLTVIDGLFQDRDLLILSGGTGLYVNAVLHGLDDMPEGDPALRQRLQQQFEQNGITALQEQLLALDPAFAQLMDLNNTQRVMRALEVCLTTGRPYSSFRQRKRVDRPFRTILIGLDRPRDELYARIDRRVESMLAAGLVSEVQTLLPYRHTAALQTVGYKEVFGYLDGAYDYAAMVELLKRNTRRYAKRQLTWFRHQNEFQWFHPDEVEGILKVMMSDE